MTSNKLKETASKMALALALVMVVTACSGKSNSPAASSSASPSSTSSSEGNEGKPEAGALPIVADKLTLDTWIVSDGNFRGQNYNEKNSFAKMEGLTNININWIQGSGADGVEAFNLLMAGGQLPDLVAYNNMVTEGPKYGQQGAFVELTPYIEQHAPNFKKILDNHPELRKLLTTADGEIYQFPQLNLHEYNLVQMYPQIRQDWLEKLKLEEPKTIDDWYTVLKAIKEGDPNGNGIADEIPYVAVNLQHIIRTFGPAFNTDWEFYVDNGKVKFAPYEAEYKELLQWLNKLYSEGLLDKNYLVDTDFKFLTEKVTTDRAGAWAGWSGSYMRSFTDLMKDHPTFKLVGTEPPVGPKGEQRFGFHAWPLGTVGVAISAKSKHIEEAVKWLDFQYSEEGIMLNNFGEEGVSYEMVDGYPKFTDAVFNNPEGLNSTESLLSYTIGGGMWSTVADERYLEQYDMEEAIEAKQKVGKYINFDKAFPPITLTAQQNDKVASLLADIRTYRDEYANGFVMGNRSFDEYDRFVQQLKQMKIEEIIAVYQEAYDNYLGK
ncbi:extracellular solute-binding protein [Paenibacillus agaridevorans]|uniref:extracellular solute-binding protein n=1 Tax=Paenibacillus agaridevorans TaxID=171404 RepID=UPI001BE41B6A|nr:extracellular solute-binding protein [Paenibacillus agaridevorans]